MSERKSESLASVLSPAREGMKLVNVKFFRGEREMIRPDEIRDQLRAVADQHNEGLKATDSAPKSKAPRTNVRDWVASL